MIKRITVITSAVLLLPVLVLAAINPTLSPANNGIDVVVNKISGSSYRIEYLTDKNIITSFGMAGEMPTATRWIAVTPDSRVSINPSGTELSLSSSDLALVPDGYDPSPVSQALTIGSAWTSKGIRFVPITFRPVATTVEGDCRLIDHARFEIGITGEEADPSCLNPTVRQMWGSLLVNRDDPRRDQGTGNLAATYIYARPSDDRVSELLQPLIELRRLEGYNVIEMVDPGNADWLRQSIINQHEDSPFPVEYVCLVGDYGGDFSIPTFINGTSDYPYGLLEGADPLPEAAVGRISYNTIQELEQIIGKIMEYELEPDLDDLDWYKRGTVAAGSERSGFSTILVSRWVRDLMLRHEYAAVDTFWWTMAGEIGDFMTDVFERGALFVNYRGWTRMEDWSERDALSLNNDHLPVAVLLACNTGDFAGRGFGYTEALLRSEGGAIGAIGTVGFQSRVSYNNALMAGYHRGVIEDGVCRLGWSLNRAKLEMFATYSAASMERVSDHAYWTNLMGDPGTVIWRGVPREVSLELPEVVSIGDGEFSVRITDEDDDPVSGVRVGLFKENEISSAAYTDDDGEALLVFDFEGVNAGTGSVTVSGDRVIPHTGEIMFRPPVQMLIYDSHTIIEDNQPPRMGNGDGVANPRETIGITVTARNFGIANIEAGARFILTTDHEACEVQEGIYNYNQVIQAGAEVDVDFLVRTLANFPDREDVPFTLTMRQGDNEWISTFSIRGAAPRWEAVNIALNRDLIPGDMVNITLDLTNTGQIGVQAFSAELISLNDYAQILNAEVFFDDSLAVGDTVFAEDNFTIALDMDTPFGITLDFEVLLISEDGYEGIISFSERVIESPLDEPTGPDEYGYWAIDNRDFGFNLAPVYNWTELDPRHGGRGHDTGLLDQVEDDDKSVVLDLPFTFQYYGDEYNRLTVCTNGWAAFGDQREYVDFRNLPIGSPQGPLAQICPWWDDLYQPDAEGCVFYYNDENNHRFIVEWFCMRRWVGLAGPGATETFQLILLDPLWHPTYTGDGDIIFQYQTVIHEARVDANSTPYATIGIGNPSDRGGLQYGFWNNWAPGAYAFPSRSVIRFSTSVRHHYALVKGSVLTALDNTPVQDATVRVTPGGWAVTDEEGIFRIATALAGENLQVTAMKSGFNSFSRELEPVNAGDSTTVAFSLTQPQIELNIDAIIDTLQDDEEAVHPFRISNAGNGELAFAMTFESHVEEERDEEWDQLFGFDVTAATEDHRILGVLFADDHFYVSGGNNGEMDNHLYVFDRAGHLEEQLDQPCQDLWGMHDLAWDGERLYGGCGRWIYSMTLDGEQFDSVSSPLIPPRGLAVDPETGDIWVVNGSDPIHHLDSEGNLLGMTAHHLRPYGLAWRGDDPDGCPLYIFSADGETNLAVNKLNPETGDYRYVMLLELEPCDRAGGCQLTTLWNGAHWVFVGVVQNPDGDRVALFDAGLNRNWISVEPESGIIEPESQQPCELTITSAGLTGGEYAIDLVVAHNAEGGEIRVPITMVYEGQWAVVQVDNPVNYQLDAVYPNPTNSAGVITFHLPQPCRVNLVVMDQTGRLVAEVVDDRYAAGSHRLIFSADALPSGIYFIRMSTNRAVKTRKFVMLK